MDKTFLDRVARSKAQVIKPSYDSVDSSMYVYKKGFIEACTNNQVEILEEILQEKGTDLVDEIFSTSNTSILLYVVMYGHLEIFNKFIALMGHHKDFDKILHISQDLIFISAVKKNQLDMANRIISLTTNIEKLDEMLHAQADKAFISAARNGFFKIIERFLELTPPSVKRESMIHARNDLAFYSAVENGRVDVVELLIKLTPDQSALDNMIYVIDKAAFQGAVKSGNLDLINRLMELTPDLTRRRLVIEENQLAFTIAVALGYLNIANRFLELTPNQVTRDSIIHNQSDYPFRAAVENGHLTLVNRLIELTPDSIERKKMINSLIEYDRFWCISSLEITHYLLSLAPDLKSSIMDNAINEKLEKRIQASDRVVQKLITLRKENGEHSVMKFFEYLKYGKSMVNIVLVGKHFITQLQDSLILDPLVDYLGDQDVTLTRKEKVWVLNALSTPGLHLEDNRNTQDEKVSFVERVLAQKAASQGRPLNYIS